MAWEFYGTAVLGILVARHDGTKVKGAAPGAKAVPASYFRSEKDKYNVAWAINQARLRLEPGDILLLEVIFAVEDEDRGINILGGPVATQGHIRAAVDRCTKQGILVIEPAGNSGADLAPLGLEARRSGALMVGASAHEGGRHPSVGGEGFQVFQVHPIGVIPDLARVMERFLADHAGGPTPDGGLPRDRLLRKH